MASRSTPSAQHRFRIQFTAERVIGAANVTEALRRAKSLGATDVPIVVRRS